ncbi:MAG: T9SS type A sorting domain-containing protein [Bacteroidetes bacterium]|nr:MAG: T9SS type A sorting domain-containing protein [Bacteroidota bacterium]
MQSHQIKIKVLILDNSNLIAMKRNLLIILLLVLCISSSHASNLSMLKEVNAEWIKNSDAQVFAGTVNTDGNMTFNDWIRTHLMLVEKTLRMRPVEHLTFNQKENRLKLLDVLNSYWIAGVYPVNDYLSYKNPVFIDRIGTHCAVGYLMQQSGAEALARAIDTDNKFVYVKDIKTNGVSEWAFENGFSIDELAWIQPGYPPIFTVGDMEQGLNGPVHSLAVDPSTQLVYAGGSFNASVKGNPCNGIAVYISGFAGWDWISLGNGVNGQVNSILIHDNKLYAGGYFSSAGWVSASNIAVYDLITEQWQAMGSLDSTVNALAVYNNEIYAGGKFTGFFSKWTGSQWQDVSQGFIYGEGVRTLEEWNGTLLIGGSFEAATGALRKNVVSYDGTYMGASGMGTITPVNDFQVYRDTLYAACDVVDGIDTCAIARFVNFDWEVYLRQYSSGMDYFNGVSLKSFLSADDRLFVAGEFNCASGFIYGNNLMEIGHDGGGQVYFSPLLLVDDVINTMTLSSNVIVFGGAFSGALNDTLNNIGELYNVITNISGPSNKFSDVQLSVFPNPSNDKLNVSLDKVVPGNEYLIKLLDNTGRELFIRKMMTNEISIDLSKSLASGLYFVQAFDQEGVLLGTNRIMFAR